MLERNLRNMARVSIPTMWSVWQWERKNWSAATTLPSLFMLSNLRQGNKILQSVFWVNDSSVMFIMWYLATDDNNILTYHSEPLVER